MSSYRIHVSGWILFIWFGCNLSPSLILSQESPFSFNQFIKHLKQKISPSPDTTSSTKEQPWHTTFSSIGTKEDHASTYLPHQYTITELAPRQGKGIIVALVDTGVGCFAFKNRNQKSKEPNGSINISYAHPHLAYCYKREHGCLAMKHMESIYTCAHNINELTNTPSLKVKRLEQWIHDYVIDNKTTAMDSWLNTYASDKKKNIKNMVTKLAKQFTQATILNNSCEQNVVREFLPTPCNKSSNDTITHGTHAYGLLKHKTTLDKSIGLCPNATCIMIKAYDEWANSNKALLIKAIQKSIDLKADIVICTLKLAPQVRPDTPASQELNKLFARVPYTIAATGNHGQDKLPYPARFDALTFSIGAFGIQKQQSKNKTKDFTLFVPAFSAFESYKGPTYLMPGVNIISTGIPSNRNEHTSAPFYTAMSGTSSASVIFGGCLALLLAEAEGMLTKQDIEYILRISSRHLRRNWKKKSLYGTPDMRSALFLIHLCKNFIKRSNGYKKHVKNIAQQGIKELKKGISYKKMPVHECIQRMVDKIYKKIPTRGNSVAHPL